MSAGIESAEGPLTIGLDLGTTGAKAGLVDASGRVLGTCSVPIAIDTPAPGWAEQDPEAWWNACRTALKGLIGSSGLDPSAVSALALSGQMHGSVFLDARGEVVRPCILWCDQRSAPQCARIVERVGTGNLRSWVSNPALPGFTAPKILWLQENEPDECERVSTLLLPKDYVNYRLTGVVATEFSDASGTLLMDVARRCWSLEMIEALEVPRGWLPDLRESTDVIGGLTPEAAGETGLAAGTPVSAGGADNACGAVGMGVTEPGRVAVSIGTSGTVLAPTEGPECDPGMRLHSFCHCMPGRWYLMGVMLAAGSALRWFRDVAGEPEVSEAGERGIDPYELLTATARGAPPGCGGLVFLPYLSGERTPHADPDARGVWFGLDLTKTRAHLVRSIMEGVLFGLEDSIDIMRELGVPLEHVVAGGGGSRSGLWMQMLSDASGFPVSTASTGDTAMLGAALLAHVSAGTFRSVDEACRETIVHAEVVEPDPPAAGAYRAAHERYRSLYPALEDLFGA